MEDGPLLLLLLLLLLLPNYSNITMITILIKYSIVCTIITSMINDSIIFIVVTMFEYRVMEDRLLLGSAQVISYSL